METNTGHVLVEQAVLAFMYSAVKPVFKCGIISLGTKRTNESIFASTPDGISKLARTKLVYLRITVLHILLMVVFYFTCFS